jgi:hypothetical protein
MNFFIHIHKDQVRTSGGPYQLVIFYLKFSDIWQNFNLGYSEIGFTWKPFLSTEYQKHQACPITRYFFN